MRIKITADSTCDLSAALREQWNISVMPMHILIGDETYQDGVDISPKDIFENLQNGGKAHTSSAANGVEYGEFFAPFAQEYEAVIHISVGSKFSSCCQNANMAAQAFNNVYVIDSENICTGQGYLVLCAARWAAEGLPVRTICTRLQRLAKRVELSFVLDRLDCMAKSGRCSGVLAFGANLLKIKPCLEVIDGELKVTKKYRGSLVSSVERYARERLEGRTDIENDMVLISSCLPQEGCVEAARNAVEAYGFGQVYETDIGSTIGGHSGPGTIGIVFARKE